MTRRIVTDAAGHMVLPQRGERASVSSWFAVQAVRSADLRTKSAAYKELAGRLHIWKGVA